LIPHTAGNSRICWEREFLCLSVNVSSRQFRGNSLIEAVRSALATNRLRPERLELEFTESLLLEDLAEIRSTINRLEACGVRFAVDDFGTGCSSLSSLNRVPLDTLKIDHSFTGGLLTDAGQSSLVDALILMAHRLELRVIAEGVERREQLEVLRGRGCDIAQGFFFSPPLPPDEFLALLGNWPSSAARTG
jgi:EAL domain-containing protein (putative c-di-GMP-specific phosphodiesterase class I)